MTQPVSTLARINSRGYHLVRKQQLQHIRPNNLTSISGKSRTFSQPSDFRPTQSIFPFTFLPLKDCSTFHLSSMFSFQSLHYAHLFPAVIFFTLCIRLSPSIYFLISPSPSPSPSLTPSSFLSTIPFTATKYLQTLPCRVSGFSPAPQGTTSNSSSVCTHPHRPTCRLMSLLSKTAPRLNIDHRASVPRTLREAICQGDNLFCSTDMVCRGLGCFFFMWSRGLTDTISGPNQGHNV